METPMMIEAAGNSCPVCAVCIVCGFWVPTAVLTGTTGILGLLP